MKVFDCLKFSIKGLLSKKTRFVLTVISILIGITSVIVISAIGSSGQAAVNGELDNLGLNGAAVKSKKLNIRIKDSMDVKNFMGDNYYVTSFSKNMAELSVNKKEYSSVVWGGESDILNVLNLNIIFGRGIREKDVTENKKVAVITKSVSEKIFNTSDSVGKKITLKTNVKEEDFTIVGVAYNSAIYDVVSANMPVFIYIPSTVYEELYLTPQVSEISVVSRNNESIDSMCDKIISFLENKNKEKDIYYYENLNVYKKSISNIADIVTLIVTLIGAVSLVVGGISVMNTMLITVNERKKEIGIKKAIGFTNLSIMAEFLLESLIIVLISCILGVVIGLSAAYILINTYSIEFNVDFSLLMKALMFSFLVGGVFGVYPAYKAAYVNPVESLRN